MVILARGMRGQAVRGVRGTVRGALRGTLRGAVRGTRGRGMMRGAIRGTFNANRSVNLQHPYKVTPTYVIVPS